MWDYHVVLIAGGQVWDLDTTLAFPCQTIEYLRRTFRIRAVEWSPRFRVVAAEEYRASLCSDRSHMRDEAGAYSAPPPAWPTIGTGTNLMRFVDLESDAAGSSEPRCVESQTVGHVERCCSPSFRQPCSQLELRPRQQVPSHSSAGCSSL